MRMSGLIGAVLAVLLFASPAMAVTFTSDDLTGTWQGFWFETTDSNSYKYWIKNTVTVDGSGNITGVWNSSTGGSGLVESGTITLSETGEVSFTMNMDDDSQVISSSAWMDLSKTYAYAATRHGARSATGLLIKTGVTTFSTADFAGSWRGLMLEGEPAPVVDPESYWIETLMSITSEAIGTGTWDFIGENTGDVSSSQLALSSAGVITGTLNIEEWAGGPVTVSDGQMDASKELGVGLCSKASGEKGRNIVIRRNRTDMAQADLAGIWQVYMDDIAEMQEQIWVYGELTIDNEGDAFGTWTDQDGNTGVLGGVFSVSIQGDLTGALSNDTEGVTFDVNKGSLCESENCAGMVLTVGDSSAPGHVLSNLFMVRKQDVQPSSPNIVGANSLLILQ